MPGSLVMFKQQHVLLLRNSVKSKYIFFTADALNADLWLLNSCTVKNPAEDGFKNEIKKARQLGKYIVVAGCGPQGQPRAEFIKGLSVVGVSYLIF